MNVFKYSYPSILWITILILTYCIYARLQHNVLRISSSPSRLVAWTSSTVSPWLLLPEWEHLTTLLLIFIPFTTPSDLLVLVLSSSLKLPSSLKPLLVTPLLLVFGDRTRLMPGRRFLTPFMPTSPMSMSSSGLSVELPSSPIWIPVVSLMSVPLMSPRHQQPCTTCSQAPYRWWN